MKILSFLASLFTSGAQGAMGAGNAVVNVATIAALSPAVIWLVANKDTEAVTFTFSYGQLTAICAIVAALLKFAQYLRPGSEADRREFK